MKSLSLAAALVLAGCCGCGEDEDEAAPPHAVGQQRASKTRPAFEPPRIATLAGLYEALPGAQPHRMCIVDAGDERRFGLLIWGALDQSCSGSGTVTRSGATLRFVMAGDSECTIEARISGKNVVFPEDTPSGCEYYCGERAGLAGAWLRQVGTGRAAAMRARDMVEEPLCRTGETIE